MAFARLYHLSDLHLAVRPLKVDPLALAAKGQALPKGWSLAWHSSYHPGALLSAVEHLVSAEAANAVLVTGDLSTSGLRADLSIAAAVLRSRPSTAHYAAHPLAGRVPEVPAGSVLPSLQPLKGVVWIPGNHDRYRWALGTPYAPGSKLFDRRPGWRPCRGRTGPRVTGPHVFGDLVVMGLDCSLDAFSQQSAPLGFLAEGIVRPKDLAQLRRATPPPSRSKFLVWMVHWPPEFPAAQARPLHGLRNEKSLLRAAKAAKVDLILSGHTHTPAVYTTSVGVPVVCCGTTAQTVGREPHTLFELTLQRAGAVFSADIARWEFDPHEVRFIRRGGWRLAGGKVARKG